MVVYCFICRRNSETNRNLSFFRFPKDEKRCTTWLRIALDSTGCPQLPKYTPDYCYNTLRVCSKHFEEKMFAGKSQNRLNIDAVPVLFDRLATERSSSTVFFEESGSRNKQPLQPIIKEEFCEPSTSTDSCKESGTVQEQLQPSISTVFCEESGTVQEQQRQPIIMEEFCEPLSTVFCEESSTVQEQLQPIIIEEFCEPPVSTVFCEENDTVQQQQLQQFMDNTCQTSKSLSSSTPRKIHLRWKVKALKKDASRKCLLKEQEPQKKLTVEDVFKFFEEHYSSNITNFIKTQMALLEKNSKGAKYSDEQNTVNCKADTSMSIIVENNKIKTEKTETLMLSSSTETKMCRVCLSENVQLINMLENSWTLGVVLQDAYQACASVVITTNDVVPPLICSLCNEKLEIAYQFRMLALQSDVTLNQIAKNLRESNKSWEWNLNDETVDYKSDIFIKSEHEFDSISPTNCDEIDPLLLLPENTNSKKKNEGHQTSKNKFYKCDLCGDEFSKSILLTEHKTNHTSCLCEICGEIVTNLNAHKKIHKYQCSHCNKTFLGAWGLKYHLFIHSGVKPYKCDICNRQFRDRSNLRGHKKIHDGYKPYQCEICKKSFLHKGSLKNHKITHTGIKAHQCEICNKMFSKLCNLKKHKRVHTGEKPYTCEYCNKPFRNHSNLTEHKFLHTGEKPYQCDVCGKRFNQRTSYKHHKCEHADKPYRCDVCDKSFILPCLLKQHQRLHSENKQTYECDICNKRFSQLGNLKKHQRSHASDSDKPYICSICYEGFEQLIHLEAHKRTHTNEKPFECTVCKKLFSKKERLKLHIRLHTGEKPYKCDVCYRSFAHVFSFISHKRVHTGEKPYKCDVCQQSFARQGTLQSHRRTHTGEKPFRCDICDQRFAQPSTMKAHRRRHTGEQPYQCDVCSKRFTEIRKFNLHKSKHLMYLARKKTMRKKLLEISN